MSKYILFLSSILYLFSLNGCVSYNRLVNYQRAGIDSLDIDSLGVGIASIPELKIQPKDVISINVYSADEETAAPFNFATDQANNFTLEAIQLSGYLVDDDGYIDFPIVGAVKVKGLSTTKAKDKIQELLKDYLKEPVVNVRLLNFRVTVSGEVESPGSFNIINERISLPDALALAGDLTDYANRSEVLLVREIDGVKTFNRVNLESREFFNSEFYYLKQNDLIYAEPLRAKAGAVSDQTDKVVPIISAIGTLVAVFVAIFR